MPFMKKLTDRGEALRAEVATHEKIVRRSRDKVANLREGLVQAKRAAVEAEQGFKDAFKGGSDAEAAQTVWRDWQEKKAQVEFAQGALDAAEEELRVSQGQLDAAQHALNTEVAQTETDKLRALADEIDTLLDRIAGKMADWIKASEAVRGIGSNELSQKLASAELGLKYVLLNNCGHPGCRTGMAGLMPGTPKRFLEFQPTPHDIERVLSPKKVLR